MRVYYLRLRSSEFTKSGGVWVSPAFDLYSNTSYKNYSTTKSKYGLNSLANDTWTGMRYSGANATDAGQLESGRFIDRSARIDVISYTYEISNQVGTHSLVPNLKVFSSPTPDAFFPDEYFLERELLSHQAIDLGDCNPWVKFELSFFETRNVDGPIIDGSGLTTTSFDCDVFIRVEIDQPVMDPLYSATSRMLSSYPEWMSMAQIDYVPATPLTAEAQSLGGKVLNAISGEWLDDLHEQALYLDLQQYIDTADTNQLAWVYKAFTHEQIVWSVKGNGVELARAYNQEEFYDSRSSEDVCLWDEETDTVYSNKLYTVLTINDIAHSQEPHHTWNSFDDIALIVDLSRRRLENNENFKLRIKDVYINMPGVGTESFKMALRRELDLWFAFDGSTPNSYAIGATPEVLEVSDLKKDALYTDEQGMPTSRFIALVDMLAKQYPTTWGNFKFNQALWDIGGEKYQGYGALPYRYDATPLSPENIQSGVGDSDDLLVYHPTVITGPRVFSAQFKLRGKQKTTRSEYPAIGFSYDVFGTASYASYTNTPKTVWLTVEISMVGGLTAYHSFQHTATSDVSAETPFTSENSYSSYEFFDYDGTSALTPFKLKTTDVLLSGFTPSDGRATLASILSVTLVNGMWNQSSLSYINQEVADTFEAWFSIDPLEVLLYNTAVGASPTASPSYNNDAATPSLLQLSTVVMKSKVAPTVALAPWTSDNYPYSIKINDTPSSLTTLPVVASIPTVPWPVSNNLLANGSFVDGLTSWSQTGALMATPLTNDGNDNLYCVGLIDTSGSDSVGIQQPLTSTIPVNAGEPLTYSAYAKQVSAGNNGTLLLRLTWQDGTYSEQTFTPTVAWAKYSFTVTVPAGKTGARAGAYLGTLFAHTGTVFIDKMELRRGSISKQLFVKLKTQDSTGAYGGYVSKQDGSRFFLANSYINLDGTNTWPSGSRTLPYTTTSVTWSSGSGAAYPLTNLEWTAFEATHSASIVGTVDENGPYRNDVPAAIGNTNYNFTSVNLLRSDFGIANTTDYIVKWIGVTSTDPRVIVWIDSNSVKPFVEEFADVTFDYPLNAAVEHLAGGVYYFDPISVKARLRLDPPAQWNPQVNSGWLYEREKEYYLYANPVDEVTSAASPSHILSGVARQGAPLIVETVEATPRSLRQVLFFNAASPITTTISNNQIVSGTGTPRLYLGYSNVYNVSVLDLVTGQSIAVISVKENCVTLASTTSTDRTYQVTYTPSYGFSVNNEYLDIDGIGHTRLTFDKTAANVGATGYKVTYEGSLYDPATPVDLPLNALYTNLSEGFVFVSHNEYPLDHVEITMSPSVIVTDGEDYALISIIAQDKYGNPKPNQTFSVATTAGIVSPSSVITNNDGYAKVMLTVSSFTATNGTLTVSGAASATLDFLMNPVKTPINTLIADVSSEQIPADGLSKVYVYGIVKTPALAPVPGAIVRWNRARSIYEVFTPKPGQATVDGYPYQGQVIADNQGRFTIGPFTSATPADTGYWFVSTDSNSATPSGYYNAATPYTIGDVVAWHEYPDQWNGVEDYSGLPKQAVQMATPIQNIPSYAYTNQFPSYYDEATPIAPATPTTPTYLPPPWYAIPPYWQWHLGLYGPVRTQPNTRLGNVRAVENDV